MIDSIGILESQSIGKGIEILDILLKASDVEVLLSREICPGKYLIIVYGKVDAVKESICITKEITEKIILDSSIISGVHKDVINGIKKCYKVLNKGAIGILEINGISSAIFALDKALKAAEVSLVKLNLGYGISGKCYFIISGDIAAIKEAIDKATKSIDSRRIISKVIIPSPYENLLNVLY